MKRVMYPAAAAACLALAVAGQARANVIASEGFQSYATDATGSPTSDNALVSNTGGTGFSAGWGVNTAAQTTLLVVDPGTPLTYNVTNAASQTVGTIAGGNRALRWDSTTNTTSNMSASRGFAAGSSADAVWARFLLRNDGGAVEDADFLSVYFQNSTSNPNFAYFGTTSPTAGDFTIRNSGTGLQNGGPEAGSGTNLVVARVTKSVPGAASTYDGIDMWVNPVLDANGVLGAPNLTGTYTSTLTAISSLGIRSTNLDATPADVLLMDELVFGTAVGDVVPGATGVVPEPSTAALAAVAAAGLLARRRHRTA